MATLPFVRRFGVVGFAVVVAVVAAGVSVAAPRPLPLSQRVIQPGEFPPFLALPGQSTTLYKSAKAWVSLNKSLTASQASSQIARMQGEGFVAVLSRQLGTQTQEPFGGLSWVMQLHSAATAKAEAAANAHDAANTNLPPAYSYAAFPVFGLPAAHGYHLTSPGGAGENLVFADGPFVYFVGFGWSTKTKNMPTRGQLIAAAKRLYKRVHGHPAA